MRTTSQIASIALGAVVACAAAAVTPAQTDFRPIPLQRQITSVQPMTGLVMWEGTKNAATDAIQLEFSYMRFADVVSRRGEYDWTRVERTLDAIASRGHQAVLGGDLSAVPENMDDGMFGQLLYVVGLSPTRYYFQGLVQLLQFLFSYFIKNLKSK